jgi:hypothetical protein
LVDSLAHSTSDLIEQASLTKFAAKNCPTLSLIQALRPPRQSELPSWERLSVFVLQALLELLVQKHPFDVRHCSLPRQLLRSSPKLLLPTLGWFIMCLSLLALKLIETLKPRLPFQQQMQRPLSWERVLFYQESLLLLFYLVCLCYSGLEVLPAIAAYIVS